MCRRLTRACASLFHSCSCVQCFQPFKDEEFYEVSTSTVSRISNCVTLFFWQIYSCFSGSTREESTVHTTSTPYLLHAAVAAVSPTLTLRDVFSHKFTCTYIQSIVVVVVFLSINLLIAGEFVIGRVIRAMSQCWHPNCFKCVSCHTELADIGFVKSQGRSVVCVCVCVSVILMYSMYT